jgi:hypothetical protein
MAMLKLYIISLLARAIKTITGRYKTRGSAGRSMIKVLLPFPAGRGLYICAGKRRRGDLCLDLTLPQSMIVDESNQFVKQVLKPV